MKLSIVVIHALSLFVCAIALPVADDLQTGWGGFWFGGTSAPIQPYIEPPPKPEREEEPAPDKYCAHRCSAKRERKSWTFLTASERSLYIEAVQELYRAGVYTQFVKVHQDGVNDPYAHGSSGFLPWHRKFLMEYENALRCLAPKFKCVTIPYWNWGEWQYYCNEQAKKDGVGCTSYDHIPANMKADNPNAQSLLKAFGGEGTKGGSGKTFGGTGHHAGVGCVRTGPFAGWKDWEGNCLTRGVDWRLNDPKNGPLTDRATLLRLTTRDDEYGTSAGYRSGIQGTPHNMAHNYLGGHMRSMRSPMDPIFFSHHAFVDKNWAVWQDCQDHEDLLANKLNRVHYEGMHRADLEDDGMDSPMPFKIETGEPFVPNSGCAEDAPGGASNSCRDCLGAMQKRSGWCDKRWHPQCAMLCSAHACMKKCGTGGTSEDLVTADFARTDGKDYEYRFNHDQLGETPRHWALAPGRFKESSFSYQIEELDRDLVEESCSMMHGGHEESELSATDLLEVQAQNSQSSLYHRTDPLSALWKRLSNTSLFKWFRGDAQKIHKANPTYSSKQVAKVVVQDWTDDQCRARDASKMCKLADGGVKEGCSWSCSGPVDEQPELCGFNAGFNYLLQDASVTVSDDCVAYASNYK